MKVSDGPLGTCRLVDVSVLEMSIPTVTMEMLEGFAGAWNTTFA